MSKKSPSEDMQQKMDAVRDAAGKLQERHYHWIVTNAIKYYANLIDESEANIVRHERFINEPRARRVVPSGEPDDSSRQTVIEETKRSIAQYRDILQFLLALEHMLMQASAEQFVRDMGAFFGSRNPLKKT